MHSILRQRVAAGVLIAAAAVALSGCGGGPTERELIASARENLANKKPEAAVVQLKSALQKSDESGEARFLLGEALLATGAPALAVLELEKARELQYSPEAVIPMLAKALVVTGQAKKVADTFGKLNLSDPAATADLKTTLAIAYGALGQADLAEAAVKAALQLNPKNSTARLQQATLLGRRFATDEALALVDGVIADEPKLREAWQLKGGLLVGGKGDEKAGVKAYREALAIDARFLPAHSALIRLALRNDDVPAFKAQFAELQKALPKHPETLYYQAQLALSEGDVKGAREQITQLLRTAPDNARVQFLAGSAEVRAGALLLAETHLVKAVQLAPEMAEARRLLAHTYLRSGQTDRVFPLLDPLLKQARPDAAALDLVAEAYLQNGDLSRAETLFAQVAKINPNDPRAQTALALAQINKGNAEAGFARLEAAAARDSGTATDLALISVRMRRNELDAALKAIDRLQAKAADKPLAYNLRGRVLALRKDAAGARASFERAVSVDAVFTPAILSLAAMDMAEKKPGDARKRIEALLAREPKNYGALMALVDVQRSLGAKPEDIGKLLADAVKLNPAEVTPRLMLIDHRLRQQDLKGANDAAQEAVAAVPDNLQLVDALGRAQLAAGQAQQAITAFGRVAAAQPTLAAPQLQLADAYLLAKDVPAAIKSLRRAVEITPNLLPAQRGLIKIATVEKRFDDAIAGAREIQKQRPKDPVGFMAESEVRLVQKQWDPAIAAMRAALDRSRSTEIATFVHVLYGKAGRPADADLFAAEWEKSFPRDAAFQTHLGASAIGRSDLPAAEARFRRVAALRPDDPLALNNLAWTLAVQGKGGGVTLAQRAVELQPGSAAMMDTLALALAADNQLPKAIEWQRKAVAKAPEAPNFRLGLAKLLVKTGDKPAARTELDTLAKLGNKFAGQAEVAALLKLL